MKYGIHVESQHYFNIGGMKKFGVEYSKDISYLLYEGDCLEIMPQLEAGSIDAVITDLPYGITACEWDSVIPLDVMWKEVKRILKPNGVFVTTAVQPFTTILINSNFDWFRYDWVWYKVAASNFMNLKNRPFRTHEDILVFSPTANFTFNPIRVMRTEKSLMRDQLGKERIVRKGTAEHYGLKDIKDGMLSSDGTKHPIDILTFPLHEKNGRYGSRHPTKKPVTLYEYLIKTYTNIGDIVLDIAMGSGTTIIAAIKTGRNSIGIERDYRYFELAKRRIRQAAFQLHLFFI